MAPSAAAEKKKKKKEEDEWEAGFREICGKFKLVVLVLAFLSLVSLLNFMSRWPMTPGVKKREKAIMPRKVAYARIAVTVSPLSALYFDEFYEPHAATFGLRDRNISYCTKTLRRQGFSVCIPWDGVLRIRSM